MYSGSFHTYITPSPKRSGIHSWPICPAVSLGMLLNLRSLALAPGPPKKTGRVCWWAGQQLLVRAPRLSLQSSFWFFFGLCLCLPYHDLNLAQSSCLCPRCLSIVFPNPFVPHSCSVDWYRVDFTEWTSIGSVMAMQGRCSVAWVWMSAPGN